MILSKNIAALLLFGFGLLVNAGTEERDVPHLVEHGKFVLHKFEQPVGQEVYDAESQGNLLVTKIDFKYTDRGREVPLSATYRSLPDLACQKFEINGKTSPQVGIDQETVLQGSTIRFRNGKDVSELTAPRTFFAISAYAPITMQMYMVRYWRAHGSPTALPAPPTRAVHIAHRGTDLVEINGQELRLERYTVDGLIWGRETLWFDNKDSLIAAITVDTDLDQFEAIREGYESGLGAFVSRAGTDGMLALRELSRNVPASHSSVFALVGGTLVDGTGAPPLPDATVIIKNKKIIAAGPSSTIDVPKGADTFDVHGKTLLPGLWDMHAHFSQVEWGPVYLAAGVTTARDCGNEFEFITAVRDAIARGEGLGPKLVLAGIVDGTSPTAVGVQKVDTPEEARKWTDRYHDAGFQQMKIYNSVHLDELKAVADEAHRLGMTVTGHVPRELDGYQAIEAGQDQINHIPFIAAMMRPPIDKNLTGADRAEASAAADASIDLDSQQAERAISFLKDHHTVVDPTLAIYELYNATTADPPAKFEPGVLKIPAELSQQLMNVAAPSALSDLRRKAWLKDVEIVGALHRAGVPVVAGTDQSVPGHSLHREMELYVQAGFTPMEAIQAATIVPARVMGMDKEVGTIEVGKRADLTILGANPLDDIRNGRKVERVITNGVMYDSAQLWQSVGFKP